ncbi:intercellular adhesion molecule 3-like isoform X1 [Pelobates cultripes]|nr:intercellular adhesion molecule 3-like isoform X1 [Pelobates cultripes]
MEPSITLFITLTVLALFWAFANSCSISVSPQNVAARYGDTVILNCTSDCINLRWKTPAIQNFKRGPHWLVLNISNYDGWEANSICFVDENFLAEVKVLFYNVSTSMHFPKMVSDKDDVLILCNVSSRVGSMPALNLNLTLSIEGKILNYTKEDAILYKLRAAPKHHLKEILCKAEIEVFEQKFSDRTKDRLYVLYGPTQVNVTSDRTTFVAGENVTLRCSGDGNPPGEYFWNIPNNRSTTFTDDKRSLVVYLASEMDSGKYECTVENNLGRSQSHIEISVTKAHAMKGLWAIILVSVLAVIGLGSFLIWWVKRRKGEETLTKE